MGKLFAAIGLISVGGAILLTAFTNCDVHSGTDLFAASPSRCVDTNDCVRQNSEFLELRINSKNSLAIQSAVNQFDIGGDCNEGGFPQNVVRWELYLEERKLRTSQDVSCDSTCVNGRFAMKVKLPTSGLADGRGTRRAHRLYVEIIAMDRNGQLFKNPLFARKFITLTPDS